MLSLRDGHASLASNGRAIDVSALPLGVLRATALQDRVRNDVMIRRRVALQAESHIVQYVNAFVGAHSDAVDATLGAQPRVWICTERMHLGSLEHLTQVQRIAFGEPHVANIVRSVAMALDMLHSVFQIAHRAVAPDAVFVNGAGVAKLSDFSIAADVTQRSGAAIALPRDLRTSKRAFWLAPEIADETAEHCERADVFSCTLLVYAMLDGASPLAALSPADAVETLRRARAEDHISLLLCTAASPLLCSFIDYGLTVLPQRRPSAGALLRHMFMRSAAPNESLVQFLQQGVQRPAQ